MNETVGNRQPAGEGAYSLKRKVIFLVALLLVVALTVWLQLVYGRHPERLAELRAQFYWGSFLISLIGNATILFPGAVLVLLSHVGALIYPVSGLPGPIIVGLVGGTGAGIGEITGYIAGYSGRGIVARKKMYTRVEGWVKKWGATAIFLFSLVPFVFDLVGIVAGVLRFPFWKFLLFCWLGRTILYMVIVTLTALGIRIVLPWFG